MPFKFNMQKVLEYREQLEEEAKVRLAKAQAQLREARQRLDDLKKQYLEAQASNAGKLMQSAERWLHDQYMKGLKGDINEAALQARMREQIAEEARQYLASKAIDRKLLDKLKEHKKNQYVKAEQKQEQYFNDEIATIRYKAPAE